MPLPALTSQCPQYKDGKKPRDPGPKRVEIRPTEIAYATANERIPCQYRPEHVLLLSTQLGKEPFKHKI
jgi:hypothetical protein